MVLLYWDIGLMILDQQEREGWGAKIIDRLAAEWTDLAFVQQVAAQIHWFHNCLLLDRVPDPTYGIGTSVR